MALSLPAALFGLFLIIATGVEVVEAIVLPHPVAFDLRLVRGVWHLWWHPWRLLARRLPPARGAILSSFGPLALLVELTLWATDLVLGFALLQWAVRSTLGGGRAASSLGDDLYFSASTFLTLGLGDLIPHGGIARLLAVVEAGAGFATLALVIGYVPTLYTAFTRREVFVASLDARAGSPPTAAALLTHYARHGRRPAFEDLLQRGELWAVETSQTHLGYSILAYFRSLHPEQNWLSALACLLDVSAFALAALPEVEAEVAEVTFTTAQRAVVDIAARLGARPHGGPAVDRLDEQQLAILLADLRARGQLLQDTPNLWDRLTTLRHQYEPHLAALGLRLALPVSAWLPDGGPGEIRDSATGARCTARAR